MAAYIFKAIAEGERLFLQAPTGIGKTMSALFPAIKAFERGKVERIFI
ncbi:MAG: DEAD/DEAH box helicase [Clostridia bacterium]